MTSKKYTELALLKDINHMQVEIPCKEATASVVKKRESKKNINLLSPFIPLQVDRQILHEWIQPTGAPSEPAEGFKFFIDYISLRDNKRSQGVASSLYAFTVAAIILPGLTNPIAHAALAEDESVDFQYSHYQEGKRDILGAPDILTGSGGDNTPQNLNPIEVDSLHGSARVSLTDRIKFSFNYTQDTWSGATPVGTAPQVAGGNRRREYFDMNTGKPITTGASPLAGNLLNFYLDKKLNLYSVKFDPLLGTSTAGQKNNRYTHVLATASPETRKQGDFALTYEWDDAAVNIGGGISVENDYESRFVNAGTRLDFNQKQTTVNLGFSYTNSDTFATVDPDSLKFISTESYEQLPREETGNGGSEEGEGGGIPLPQPIEDSPAQIDSTYDSDTGIRTGAVVRGKREDWGGQLGLTHVLNKDAVLDIGLSYNHSAGYLANPYKLIYRFETLFIDGAANNEPAFVSGFGVLETRPDERNQFNWNLGYNQYIQPFDAALHFNYRFAHDDWGINAHTFEADWVQPVGAGWTLTPRVRYYSQTGADFYTPSIFVIRTLDELGNPVTTALTRDPPKYFSSDQRLSGFGALSGGVTVAKQFAKGIQLEAGFEYYTHQGSLKMGGGGEQDFADYDYWVANAALKVNLAALDSVTGGHNGHAGNSHQHHAHSNAPAGVMFDHVLDKSGDFMVGYRYMRSEQAGDMLLGAKPISLNALRFEGCGSRECSASPRQMNMSMHMLDLMVAPTDWLTLMLMPQWIDMDMDMNHLTPPRLTGHNHAIPGDNHQTGGIGDVGMYALFKLFEGSGHHIILSLGATVPTGDVDVNLRQTNITLADNPIHYGMQLGSGTWDFKPSLTYTGESDRFSWGAQITGTKRLESHNKSGFAFGDIFQGSVWGGYQWTNWLSTTVRGVYTQQGKIRGGYPTLNQTFTDGSSISTPYPYSNHVGPFDFPANYGGQFVDLGLGVNVSIPSGTFAGNTLKFEWLQPIRTDYNGYQLERDGALAATWSYGF